MSEGYNPYRDDHGKFRSKDDVGNIEAKVANDYQNAIDNGDTEAEKAIGEYAMEHQPESELGKKLLIEKYGLSTFRKNEAAERRAKNSELLKTRIANTRKANKVFDRVVNPEDNRHTLNEKISSGNYSEEEVSELIRRRDLLTELPEESRPESLNRLHKYSVSLAKDRLDSSIAKTTKNETKVEENRIANKQLQEIVKNGETSIQQSQNPILERYRKAGLSPQEALVKSDAANKRADAALRQSRREWQNNYDELRERENARFTKSDALYASFRAREITESDLNHAELSAIVAESEKWQTLTDSKGYDKHADRAKEELQLRAAKPIYTLPEFTRENVQNGTFYEAFDNAMGVDHNEFYVFQEGGSSEKDLWTEKRLPYVKTRIQSIKDAHVRERELVKRQFKN